MYFPPRPARLGLAFLLLAVAAEACGSPRVHVEGVAAVIEEHYFDESRAAEIGTKLRAAAAQGDFDALQDERELSAALSRWLSPLDAHFNVSWHKPQPEATPPLADSPLPTGAPLRQARENFGVRRIEVLPGNVGYLDLRRFALFEFGEPDQAARQKIEAGLQLLSGTQALIIDLRENGGGAPQMVGYLGSAFVKRGADIFNTFHGRGRTMSEAPLDWYPRPDLETPLYILISGRTASAAEAFAYTLQSAGRAVVVGEASMGAANPGGELDAGHGFRVFVSFASPVNPITRTNWEGRGVVPDVAVGSGVALDTARRLALQTILKTAAAGTDTTDARWALDALIAEAEARPVNAADYVDLYGTLTLSEAGGRLLLINGRRPPRTLLALGEDRFAVAEDPSQRVTFTRDAQGRVEALESSNSMGEVTRHRRGP